MLRSLAFVVVVVMLAAPLFAAGPEATWSEQCHADDGTPFTLTFASRSGDPYEDDMSITLRLGDRELPLDVEPNLFIPRMLLANTPSLCREGAALDLGSGRVAFLLAESGRPQTEQLDVVLVDLRSMKVLDRRMRLGALKGESVIAGRPVAAGVYDLRVTREYLRNACDCEEALIDDWMRVSVRGGKLWTRWAR